MTMNTMDFIKHDETPLFLLITSPIILGEFPGFLGVVGIVFIVAGSYVLHLKSHRNNFWDPFRCLIREKGLRAVTSDPS